MEYTDEAIVTALVNKYRKELQKYGFRMATPSQKAEFSKHINLGNILNIFTLNEGLFLAGVAYTPSSEVDSITPWKTPHLFHVHVVATPLGEDARVAVALGSVWEYIEDVASELDDLEGGDYSWQYGQGREQ